MITLSIVLNCWFIPIPFWVLGLTKRYYRYRENARESVGMAFIWPILIFVYIWFLIKPRKQNPPVEKSPVEEK